MGNKKNLFSGILYLFLVLGCIIGIFTTKLQSYMITGIVIFSFLGIAYIRKYIGHKL